MANDKLNILVVFYNMTGNVVKLAKTMLKVQGTSRILKWESLAKRRTGK